MCNTLILKNHPVKVYFADSLGDFILWRKDNLAAYQLVSVWEDEQAKITHIVRGKDLMDSTAAQVWLAHELEYHHFTQVKFYHHGLLKGPNADKLSKSAGAASLKAQREDNIPSQKIFEAFIDWMGWPQKPTATLEELTHYFLVQAYAQNITPLGE